MHHPEYLDMVWILDRLTILKSLAVRGKEKFGEASAPGVRCGAARELRH